MVVRDVAFFKGEHSQCLGSLAQQPEEGRRIQMDQVVSTEVQHLQVGSMLTIC
ncbi:hypothetical protein I79_022648 [Cricetulus griseus]|uniref:Uncharacterized protein n=1 Tax=Cricetulus griseus TaxID=10029 RepID=G3IFX4_CRIGR|nr:hypothetical protein I79_022648 [Cricetulus griseus]